MDLSRRQGLTACTAAATTLIAGRGEAAPSRQQHAFAFQTGSWRVEHRKLAQRLAGSDQWIAFGGTCRAWETLAGGGNVEDHVIDDPRGAYRAGAYRMLDPATDRWSIWWFDPRSPALSPPVIGAFDGPTGLFHADDSFDGRPIQVRFIWRVDDRDHLHWEQAFSDDAGQSWETNWTMRFVRTGA